ncbi:MAG: oligosaccharide flippase family protein, partial [Promethearchaeota archaeon]
LENKKNKKQLTQNQRVLAKNTFYSFLQSYGVFFFSLITSFFIARMITQEEWGFLFLTLSYITIFTLFLGFCPPSLADSVKYYIPTYRALEQNTKLKSFIINAIIIRILFVIPIFLISVAIFTIFIDFFSLNLKNHVYLFYLLVPLILINGIDKIFNGINQSLNMFRTVFILIVIKYVFFIGSLIYFFLFVKDVQVDTIALITLYANLIPFLINCFIMFFIIEFKIKKTAEEKEKLKETFKNLYKYGSYLSVKNFIISFTKEFRTQSIGFFESPEVVTGWSIARHYADISREAVGALSAPLTISFSELHTSKRFNEIVKIFNILFLYSVFLILLITGILLFIVDIFLFIVYGESYLVFGLMLKLLLMIVIFNVLGSFFFSLLRASNKVKYMIPIILINVSIRMPLFLIGLIFFGVHWAIIGLLIGNIIIFGLYAMFCFKIFNIRLKIPKAVQLYLIFFAALGITLILENIILKDFNTAILRYLNLTIFEHFQFISLGLFLVLFFSLIVISGIFSQSDIENIEAFFNRDNLLHKIIRKGLNILKRVMRK